MRPSGRLHRLALPAVVMLLLSLLLPRPASAGGHPSASFNGVQQNCGGPQVYLDPTHGPVGTRFLMKGGRWAAGVVHIELPDGSKGQFFAESANPEVDAGGGWQTWMTVGDSPPGTYTFTFWQTTRQCGPHENRLTATFQVM